VVRPVSIPVKRDEAKANVDSLAKTPRTRPQTIDAARHT